MGIVKGRMRIVIIQDFIFEILGRGGHRNGSPQKREGHAERQPINPAEIRMDKPLCAALNSR